MSLSTVQFELVRLLSRQTEGATASNLTSNERKWLQSVMSSQGIGVTRDIIEWWRRARLNTAMPLTVKHLQLLDRNDVIDGYLQQATCQTLFAALEGRHFLQYLKIVCPSPDIMSLATFETELRLAHAVRKEQRPGEYRHKSTVIFPCDPRELICAVLNGSTKNLDHYEPTYVEIDSNLPTLWRCLEQSLPAPAENNGV